MEKRQNAMKGLLDICGFHASVYFKEENFEFMLCMSKHFLHLLNFEDLLTSHHNYENYQCKKIIHGS